MHCDWYNCCYSPLGTDRISADVLTEGPGTVAEEGWSRVSGRHSDYPIQTAARCWKGSLCGLLCTTADFKLNPMFPLFPHPVCSLSTERRDRDRERERKKVSLSETEGRERKKVSLSLSLSLPSVSVSSWKSLNDLTGHCGNLKKNNVSWIQCWFWNQLSFCCLDDMFYINDWF